MNTCSGYGEEFEQGDNDDNPVTELGDMFLQGTTGSNAEDLCSKCRKEFGADHFARTASARIEEITPSGRRS